MGSPTRRAGLYSGFDGTAVENLSNKHPWRWPQNMMKFPLHPLPGWADFLEGAMEVDGVAYRGIVTRRRKRGRMKVTQLSLARTGLSSDFDYVRYKGSEEAKARVLSDAAQENLASTTIGMIEDMPQKLVPNIVAQLERTTIYSDLSLPKPRITVGVVDHPSAMSRIERLVEEINIIEKNDARLWDGYYHGVHVEPNQDGGIGISSGKMDIDVIPLQPYSKEAGIMFGERLVAAPLAPRQPTY